MLKKIFIPPKVRAKIFVCHRCWKIRVHGEWHKRTEFEDYVLKKNLPYWEAVYEHCPECAVKSVSCECAELAGVI